MSEMTNEEEIAIAIIRNEYLCVDRDCDIERSCGKCDLAMPNKEPILKAFKMAIKALETIPKYKDAYNKGWDDGAKATYEHLKMCEEEQEPILDKIRAEIERVFCISVVTNELRTPMEVKTEILQIIDKYKAESEVSK